MRTVKTNFEPDFLIIPYQIAFDKKIHPSDKLVYAVVYWLHAMKEGSCYASNELLAKILGLNAWSVANSLTRLQRARYITRKFTEESKRKRTQIIPMVVYKSRLFHQTMKRVSSNNETVFHHPMNRTIRDNYNNKLYSRNTVSVGGLKSLKSIFQERGKK